MEICIYIGAQQSRVESINHARSLGWPIDIDFQGLHNRIAKMKDEIAKLLFVEGLASGDPVLCRFTKDLQGKNSTIKEAIEKLQRVKEVPEVIRMNARPG
jgi:hypothetical protein